MRSVRRALPVLVFSLAFGSCGSSERSSLARQTASDVHTPAGMGEPSEAIETVDAPAAIDAATLAAGRTLVAVGPDGFLSTWRRARPSSSDAATPIDVVVQPSFRMELEDIAPRGASTVQLEADLLSPEDTHLYLMISLRGRARVILDGEVLGEAESADRYRRDRLFVRVPLATGEHTIAVSFERPERGRWRGAVRFLSTRHRAGPGNVAIALGLIEPARVDQSLARAVAFDERHQLHEGTPSVRVRASLPGGGIRQPIDVTIGETTATLMPEVGVHAGELVHRVALPERGALSIDARVGDRTERLGLRAVADRGALMAAASLAAIAPRAPETSRGPIAWRQQELERIVKEHDPDSAWRSLMIAEARSIVRAIEREQDPFGTIRGYQRMGFISRLDGTAQLYELFVPPGYRADAGRRWPLLVTLHGFKGNAGDYFRNTFGLARNAQDGETLDGHGRHGVAPERGPMIVIGPTGRGQTFYRQAGETDVMEAMDDVRRRFAIDERRVYITGGSMGGTGAAYLPYRMPDVFAASAALAGYHDQRVREDTNHDGLSEAERFLTAHRSDVDWAENGLHLPTLLVRGTRDRPLEWTRVLVRRLAALGYDHEHREPDLGHNVWSETYANGAIFTWMMRHQRPENPAHVHLRTARERTDHAYWVRVDQRMRADAFADVDARIENGVVTARIEGARAVTFSPPPPLLAEGSELTVRVGGDEIRGPAPLTIERNEQGFLRSVRRWPEVGARRPGVSGPIRDVYEEPLTFVVGTQDPDHTLINRVVARHWSHPKGWIVSYPIIDDVDVTDEMMRDRALVLIGPPSSNAVLARFADRLPIRIAEGGVTLHGRTFEGSQLGTVFVAPNPLYPSRSVLVIAGATPLGTWRSTQLPDILPDYVIFDERVEPARDQWACGGTGCEYRAHGFFDMYFR